MAALGAQTLVTPVTAVKEVKAILTDYISKKNPWHEKAQLQLDAFNAQFPLSPGDLPTKKFSLDEVKAYTLDTLAPQFTSIFQWIALSAGNSHLRQSLEGAAKKWPSHIEYLEQRTQIAEAQIIAFPEQKRSAIAEALTSQKNLLDQDHTGAIASLNAQHQLALEEVKKDLEGRMKAEIERIEARHAEEQTKALAEQMERLKLESATESKEHCAKVQSLANDLARKLQVATEELAILKATRTKPESFPPLLTANLPSSAIVPQYANSPQTAPTSTNYANAAKKTPEGSHTPSPTPTNNPGPGRGRGGHVPPTPGRKK